MMDTQKKILEICSGDAEIIVRLKIYEDLLLKWSRKINLVAPSTLDDIWSRHFLDSMQLLPHIPKDASSVADMGSGAGFPGLVLAIAGIQNISLIESDLKKCQFLQEVARQTKTDVKIVSARVEDVDASFDVITARALASLSDLLSMATKISTPRSLFLFLKGESWSKELTDAQKLWHIKVEAVSSATSTTSSALKIKEVAHVKP